MQIERLTFDDLAHTAEESWQGFRPLTLDSFRRYRHGSAADAFALSGHATPGSGEDQAAFPAEPPPPPPVTLSADAYAQALADAEARGYAQGKLAGQAAGEAAAQAAAHALQQAEAATQAAAIHDALHHIARAVASMEQMQTAFLQEQTEEISALALAIAKKIAGAALKSDPLAEVTRLVQECLGTLVGDTALTVWVHESLTASLTQTLQAQGLTESGRVTVCGDRAIRPGDCRIGWPGGQAERDTEAMWQEIIRLVQAYHPVTQEQRREDTQERSGNASAPREAPSRETPSRETFTPAGTVTGATVRPFPVPNAQSQPAERPTAAVRP